MIELTITPVVKSVSGKVLSSGELNFNLTSNLPLLVRSYFEARRYEQSGLDHYFRLLSTGLDAIARQHSSDRKALLVLEVNIRVADDLQSAENTLVFKLSSTLLSHCVQLIYEQTQVLARGY